MHLITCSGRIQLVWVANAARLANLLRVVGQMARLCHLTMPALTWLLAGLKIKACYMAVVHMARDLPTKLCQVLSQWVLLPAATPSKAEL